MSTSSLPYLLSEGAHTLLYSVSLYTIPSIPQALSKKRILLNFFTQRVALYYNYAIYIYYSPYFI